MRVPKSICALTECCDSEASRYALGGVLFGRTKKRPFAVATDGRRLMHVSWDEGDLLEFENEQPAGDGRGDQQIVAISTVKELAGLCNGSRGTDAKRFFLDESTPNVTASFAEKDIKRTVETKPIEGRFPKWQDVLPTKDPVSSVRMGATLLLSTLKAAVAALECKGPDGSLVLDIMPDADGKPTMLRISGEHDGKVLTAVQMAVDKS